MKIPMLVIDNDLEVFQREQPASDNRGIPTVRVDSMQEAIEKHSRGLPYLFTVINADNISYKPLFKVLRDITDAPILIITSDFKISDQTEAFMLGADGYTVFHSPEENIDSALSLLHRHTEKRKQSEQHEIISFKSFLFYPKFHQASYNDQDLSLTKQEFDLFCYFIKNQGLILTRNQIISNVWGDEYIFYSNNVLNCAVRRLRIILGKLPGAKNCIRTVRGVGYKFDCKSLK